MESILTSSEYFGIFITIAIFLACVWIKNKTKLNLLNPLLISTIIIIALLCIFNIKYETYYNGAKYLSYFLTPTTVCLAIPLYKQVNKLKQNIVAILSGILAGCIANAVVIVLLCKLFNIPKELAASLLPKSVTTPIAVGISTELGGIAAITVFAVILSGLVGAVIAPYVYKIFKIKNPVSQGLGSGTSAHALGTTAAIELGEVQAAMSALAINVTGLMTVFIAPIVSNIFFT